MSDWIDSHFGVLVTVGLIVIAGLIYLGYSRDEKEWAKYASAHHCVVKGTKYGQSGSGVSSDGKSVVMVTEPDQTIYICDGNEMVIR